jgi:Uma2 family endonuclease
VIPAGGPRHVIFGHARGRCIAEEGMASHMATGVKHWTLEELHSLPDDGNKYELIRGELFVTPPPADDHETVLARLTRLLDRYVEGNGLGQVYRPRAVFRLGGSEVEPDLMVRQEAPGIGNAWQNAPHPILIVEVLSPSTRRRDLAQKKEFYVDARIPEYWVVDPESKEITVIRPGEADQRVNDFLTWRPAGARESFTFRVMEIFPDPAGDTA